MPRPDGGYRTKAGKVVPGVTTIIGRFKESGGLVRWAFEQGKLYERGEIHGLNDKRDKAAEAGTIVHLLVQEYLCREQG